MKRETKKAKAARLAKRRAEYARKVAAEKRRREHRNALARERRARAKREAEEKRERRNARARERRAEKRALELAQVERKAARRERESVAGELVAVVVTVGRPASGLPWSAAPSVRDAVAASVRAATGGKVEPGDNAFQATIRQPYPRTHAALAADLARAELVPLHGGSLHFGVMTRDGRYVSISRAFRTMGEARSMAVDELLKSLLSYGASFLEEPAEEESDGDNSDEFGAPE